jgi:trehalose-6-phosphate synthase
MPIVEPPMQTERGKENVNKALRKDKKRNRSRRKTIRKNVERHNSKKNESTLPTPQQKKINKTWREVDSRRKRIC